MLECILQLQPSAADELGRLTQQPDRSVRAHKGSALLDLPMAGQDLPGKNQRLCFLARISKAAFYEQSVYADFGPRSCHTPKISLCRRRK